MLEAEGLKIVNDDWETEVSLWISGIYQKRHFGWRGPFKEPVKANLSSALRPISQTNHQIFILFRDRSVELSLPGLPAPSILKGAIINRLQPFEDCAKLGWLSPMRASRAESRFCCIIRGGNIVNRLEMFPESSHNWIDKNYWSIRGTNKLMP